MRTKLIAALRAAANEVETSPDNYNWSSMSKCNCGIVASHLAYDGNRNAVSDAVLLNPDTPGGIWSDIAERSITCAQTGAPLCELVGKLNDAGLTCPEMIELEYLSNKSVRAALPVLTEDEQGAPHTKRENFILYARKWADLMESGVVE
jgi:hypothetical protein